MHHSCLKTRVYSHLRQTSVVATVISAAAFAAASPAMAQADSGATSGSDNGIQEIVVTAEFRKGNVQDTPIAITALNADMLEARSQTNIVQAATAAPGVTLTRAPDGANGSAISASIRGVGQLDANPALEPGVGIYVDDVYYSQLTGSMLDLLDLDRVEVLRGPQGTLQGKNSIGGAVKLFSRVPTGKDEAEFALTYGSFNRIEGRASAGFSIIPDKLFARASLVSKDQRGYVTRKDFACAVPTLTYTDVNGVLHTNAANPLPTNTPSSDCVLGHLGGSNFTAGRLALRWLVSDTIENTIIGDYSTDHSESPASTIIEMQDGSSPGGPRISDIGRQNISYNGLPASTAKVPDLIPSDPYVSYSTFFIPGGTKLTSNGGPVTISSLSADPNGSLRSWGVSDTFDWQAGDNLALKSITAYREFTSNSAKDGDGSPLGNGLGIDKFDHWQFSQEVRLSGSLLDQKLEYTLGGFYFDQKTTYSTHQALLYTSALFNFLGDDPVKSTTKAAFLQTIWHATDDLEFVGGVRYTDDSKTYTFSRRNGDTFGGAVALGSVPTTPVICPIPNPPFVPVPPFDCAPNYNYQVAGLDGASSTASTKRVDWRAAVDYHWSPNVMSYLQFTTGFKGGGINPRPFNLAQVLPFGPETLKAYEFGLKGTWFGALRLNGSLFYNQYENVQVTISNCSAQAGAAFGFPCAMPINGGDATVWGAELEGELHPFKGLSIDASASYIDFSYDRVAAGSGISLSAVSPYTPQWKWNAGIQYDIDMGRLGTLTPHFDINYQASFYTNPTNTPGSLVDSRTIANARLKWQAPDETLSVALEVTNLFDKFYYFNKFDLVTSNGNLTGQVAPPREWAVTVKKKF